MKGPEVIKHFEEALRQVAPHVNEIGKIFNWNVDVTVIISVPDVTGSAIIASSEKYMLAKNIIEKLKENDGQNMVSNNFTEVVHGDNCDCPEGTVH